MERHLPPNLPGGWAREPVNVVLRRLYGSGEAADHSVRLSRERYWLVEQEGRVCAGGGDQHQGDAEKNCPHREAVGTEPRPLMDRSGWPSPARWRSVALGATAADRDRAAAGNASSRYRSPRHRVTGPPSSRYRSSRYRVTGKPFARRRSRRGTGIGRNGCVPVLLPSAVVV